MADVVAAEDINPKLVKKRIEWIDVAKGIAMILVFYGHLPGSGNNPWFPDLMTSRTIVYYFHMPLFFILSGLTLHLDEDFRTFIWKRFRRLIVPYYFFSLYALGKVALKLVSPAAFESFHSKGTGNPWQELISIILGNSFGLWFFWALFWGDLLLWTINSIFGKHPALCLIPFALVAWHLLDTVSTGIPFHLQLAFEAYAFAGIGILASKGLKRTDVSKALPGMIAALLLFILSAWLLYESDSRNLLWTLIPAIASATAGSFMIMYLSMLIPPHSWVTYIGKNTIVFYGLNGLSLALAKAVFFHVVAVRFVVSNVALQFFAGVAVICIALLVCWIANIMVSRWFWWAIGAKRKDAAT